MSNYKYIEFDCPHSENFDCCIFCQYKEYCNANVKYVGFNLERVIYYKYLKDKLSPCAYCGAEMKLLEERNGYAGIPWHYKIECEHDRNCLLRHTNIKISVQESKKDVIRMCNQRYMKKRPKEN